MEGKVVALDGKYLVLSMRRPRRLEYLVWSTVVWSVGVLRASAMEFGRCAKVL